MKNIDLLSNHPDSIRFIGIEAGEIYHSILYKYDLVIENKNDLFDSHFSDLMPPDLDLIYLHQQGKLKYKELNDEFYSYDLVSVSFKYDLRVNDKGERVFKQKEATQTYSSEDIRKELYLNGFILNGKKYVRYKRSARAAKNNTCIFIKENLFNLLNKWSLTGLNESKDKYLSSLTSYEAYRALSISNLSSTITLNPYNILFVKDFETFVNDEEVIRVSCDEKSNLVGIKDKCNIKNNIFDGEGLLDISVFKSSGNDMKSMMLLRNRFFKGCVFNTNLQAWFKENNITSIDQLNGITFAKKVEDIVLVVSESCLKYIKMCDGAFNMTNIKRWCDAVADENNESLFGIVKTDKKTRFFDGEMVETTYQFLNTVQLKDADIKMLIKPYFEFIESIHDIKNHPEFVRYYLERGTNDDDEVDDSEDSFSEQVLEYSSYSFKNKVCLDLMKIDKDIVHTSLFKDHIYKKLIDSFLLKIYNGRLLVDGTNATLFGNPYEYLNYIILKDGKPVFSEDNKQTLLGKNEIYCSFFSSGEEVVGMRSPHTTMGNLLYVKNKYLREIKKWFNLSSNIVVVDAVNNNIQHRLSGCDYDSDFMLLTNNPVIKRRVSENYKNFLVPYANISPKNKPIEHFSDDKKINQILNLANIDHLIAGNNVGKIVNLSQLLNSHLWNKYNKNKRFDFNEIYSKIAILSVLSGAEIDSSKRTFDFDTTEQYNALKKWARNSGYLDSEPQFFANLSNKKGQHLKIGEIRQIIDTGARFNTAMDLLWKDVSDIKIYDEKNKINTIPFFDFVCGDFSTQGFSATVYKQRDAALEALKVTRQIIKDNNLARKNSDDYELALRNFKTDINNCYKKIKTGINSVKKAKLLIKEVEKENGLTKAGNKTKYGDQLLYILLYIISIREEELGYSLKDLFKIDSEGVPTLRKTGANERFEYTLFTSHHYKIDDVEMAINKILRKI